ncbi:MAG: hypothetical protein AB8B50_13370 [Pirellulaceae bacterium]
MNNRTLMQAFCLASTAGICLAFLGSANAADPQENGQRRGSRAKSSERSGDRTNRPVGQRPDQRPNVDMQRVVSRMLEQFDLDGDEKLDVKELTKLLTAMRERGRGQGFMQGDRSRPEAGRNRGLGVDGKPDASKSKRQKRGTPNMDADEGGDIPKRPGKKAPSEVPNVL